jgi:hypothetical protein
MTVLGAVIGKLTIQSVLAAGDLRFHGGITGARGHAEDNAGCSAVESYANTGAAPLAQTPVFGCPLFNEPTSQTP